MYVCIIKFNNTSLFTLDAPVIDEGSFVPRPSVIGSGTKRVKIGTPVYVQDGFDVIIDCIIVGGKLPITITWFRNGSSDLTRGNASTTITITDASNGDVFECRAENNIGFDIKNTTIHVECSKYIIRIELPRYRNFLYHISWKFMSRYEHISRYEHMYVIMI